MKKKLARYSSRCCGVSAIVLGVLWIKTNYSQGKVWLWPWFGKNIMEHFCETSLLISILHIYLCNQLSHVYRNPESVYMFPPPTTWRLLQTKQLSWIIVCNSVGYLGSFCCCWNLFIQKRCTAMKNTWKIYDLFFYGKYFFLSDVLMKQLTENLQK